MNICAHQQSARFVRRKAVVGRKTSTDYKIISLLITRLCWAASIDRLCQPATYGLRTPLFLQWRPFSSSQSLPMLLLSVEPRGRRVERTLRMSDLSVALPWQRDYTSNSSCNGTSRVCTERSTVFVMYSTFKLWSSVKKRENYCVKNTWMFPKMHSLRVWVFQKQEKMQP